MEFEAPAPSSVDYFYYSTNIDSEIVLENVLWNGALVNMRMWMDRIMYDETNGYYMWPRIDITKTMDHPATGINGQSTLLPDFVTISAYAGGECYATNTYNLEVLDDVPFVGIMDDFADIRIGADNGEGSRIEVSKNQAGSDKYVWETPAGETTDLKTLARGETWVSTDGRMSVMHDEKGYHFTLLKGERPEDIDARNIDISINQTDGYSGDIFTIINAGADREGFKITWDADTSDYGQFNGNADGTWSFVPNAAKMATLQIGDSVSQSMRYTYTDGDGNELYGSIRLNILGTIKTYEGVKVQNPEPVVFHESDFADGTHPDPNFGTKTIFIPIDAPDGISAISGIGKLDGSKNSHAITDGRGNCYYIFKSYVDGGILVEISPLKNWNHNENGFAYKISTIENVFDGNELTHTIDFIITDKNNVQTTVTAQIKVIDDAPEFNSQHKTFTETDIITNDDIPEGNVFVCDIPADVQRTVTTGDITSWINKGADRAGATFEWDALDLRYGTATVNPDGTWDYTPDAAARADIKAGVIVTDRIGFTYTDGDGDALHAEIVLNVAVTGTDDSGSRIAIGNSSEGAVVTISFDNPPTEDAVVTYAVNGVDYFGTVAAGESGFSAVIPAPAEVDGGKWNVDAEITGITGGGWTHALPGASVKGEYEINAITPETGLENIASGEEASAILEEFSLEDDSKDIPAAEFTEPAGGIETPIVPSSEDMTTANAMNMLVMAH